MDFQNAVALMEHQRTEHICEIITDTNRLEYVDERVKKELGRQVPKKGEQRLSDHAKWERLFQMLFPDHTPIPSPCKFLCCFVVDWPWNIRAAKECQFTNTTIPVPNFINLLDR
jgi:hypothetical protein